MNSEHDSKIRESLASPASELTNLEKVAAAAIADELTKLEKVAVAAMQALIQNQSDPIVAVLIREANLESMHFYAEVVAKASLIYAQNLLKEAEKVTHLKDYYCFSCMEIVSNSDNFCSQCGSTNIHPYKTLNSLG